ncbi:hypothetical protein [Rhizobium sp. 21-4511-3d]
MGSVRQIIYRTLPARLASDLIVRHQFVTGSTALVERVRYRRHQLGDRRRILRKPPLSRDRLHDVDANAQVML